MSEKCQERPTHRSKQHSYLITSSARANLQGCGLCDRFLRASVSALILSSLALSVVLVALPSLGFEPMTTVLVRDVLYPLGMGPVELAGPMAVEGPRFALAASITAFSRARAASAAVGAVRTTGAAVGAVRTTGVGARTTGAGAARTTGAAAGAVRTTAAGARTTGAGAARTTGAGAARTTGAGAGAGRAAGV